MRIELNGSPCEVTTTRLSDVLDELGYREGPLATALNEVFVKRDERERVYLSEGDRLEVLAPMQGG